ncbi:MAG: DUF3667 domain-containing protein [Bacteroidota bacterium]
MKCKNCGNEFTGKFCNNCGQTSEMTKMDHRYIADELGKTFLRFDSGFFKTTRDLFTRPGEFIHNYLEGKRVNYVRPFTYLIITGGLYILIHNYFRIEFVTEDVEGIDRSKVNSFFTSYYTQIQLVLLPFYSGLSVLLFKRTPYNYYEFIVIHTYLAAQRIQFNTLFIPLFLWLGTDSHLLRWLNILVGFVAYLLMLRTYFYLFRQTSKPVVIIKTLALQVLIVVTLFVILGSVLYFFT